MRVIIGDPHAKRQVKNKQCRVTKETLSKAKRAVKRQSEKKLLKKRGEHIERSFCHVHAHGKLRQATLRGRENLTKLSSGISIFQQAAGETK